jgi:predicted ATPase
MITKVRVRYFKQFEDEQFDLADHVVLAGHNNSGKTTLLQAIAVWNLALQRWLADRPPTSKARKRTGVPITRKDFTAIPLREMKLLWTNTSVSLKSEDAEEGKAGYPKVMEIALEGADGSDAWQLGFEFRYQSPEQIYVKPSEANLDALPHAAEQTRVVHVPAFSGIGAEETRYDHPYQDLLIGQGKPGDIVRNLLLEIHQQQDASAWDELCTAIKNIFVYQLLPPQYEGKPFILCEYLRGVPRGKGKNGLPQLDIASAGSGFHQVLLLLGFFYARPATVLLLDEPDAHLHVILQKQVYDMLRRIAMARRCQLIIATHSEVLINATSPNMILSFLKKPHRLVSDVDRDEVAEALKRLTAMDVCLAEQSPGVLYVEGDTDFDLLKAWATVLKHPLKAWFEKHPFWHANQGRNPREAKDHFFALRAIQRGMSGLLLLDGDNRDAQTRDVRADGLHVERWVRYEAESYLVHPEALRRFIESRRGPLFAVAAEKFLQDQLPPAVYRDPLGDHEYFQSTKVSKSLLPTFFQRAQVPLGKSEYYLVAEKMLPEEIPAEVRDKLDAIARVVGIM